MPAARRQDPGAPQISGGGVPLGWIIGFATVLGVIAVGFVIWFVALQDTWEAESAARVSVLATDVSACDTGGQFESAIEKCDQLRQMVGSHQIRDPELRVAVQKALEIGVRRKEQVEQKRVAEENKRREGESRVTLEQLEQRGSSLEAANDLEGAKQRFGEALSLIQSRGASDKTFAANAQRITAAVARIDTTLAARAEGARVQREREAKEAALKSIKAKIRGGAWLTRKAGTSDILRGLEVLAIDRWVPTSETAAVHEATLLRHKAELVTSTEKLDKATEDAKRYPPDIYARSIELSKEMIAICNRQIGLQEAELIRVRTAKPTDVSDLVQLSMRIGEEGNSPDAIAFVQLAVKHTVATTHADIDGKYEVVVHGGSVCVFALSETAISRVLWCVPVAVEDTLDHPLDLRNDNATSIWNKPR